MIINFIAFQLCWLGGVWGAANGMAWLGPVAVIAFLVWELANSSNQRRDLTYVLLVAMLGFAVDTSYRQLGLIEFASAWPSPAVAPLWIVTMWVSFALTINSSLRWLAGRYWLGAAFGLMGGPFSYWIAIEIWNAGTFTAPLAVSLSVIGVAWAIATPALFALFDATDRLASNDRASILAAPHANQEAL